MGNRELHWRNVTQTVPTGRMQHLNEDDNTRTRTPALNFGGDFRSESSQFIGNTFSSHGSIYVNSSGMLTTVLFKHLEFEDCDL